jgi:membrane-associated phospholipid phosphatase
LFPAGISLIVATVYLRYHYVIDLIAGAAFMLFTIWSGRYIEQWWKGKVRAFASRSERVSDG